MERPTRKRSPPCLVQTIVKPVPPLFDEARLAVAGFLARYSTPARRSYACDLRQFFAWCASVELQIFDLKRGGQTARACRLSRAWASVPFRGPVRDQSRARHFRMGRLGSAGDVMRHSRSRRVVRDVTGSAEYALPGLCTKGRYPGPTKGPGSDEDSQLGLKSLAAYLCARSSGSATRMACLTSVHETDDMEETMSRRVLTHVVGAGTILAITTAVVGVDAPSAGASVVSQCGQIMGTAPPSNVAGSVGVSNTTMPVFQEQMNLSLPSALAVDITPPASFPAVYNSPSKLTPGNIASGTSVDSYMAYASPTSKQASPQFNYVATLNFSSPVLGVIVSSSTLNNTDSVVGAPGTTYPHDAFRGLELGSSAGDGDVVKLLTPNSIYLFINTNLDIDEVRVITAGSTSGSVTGTAPQYTEVAADGGIFNFGSQFFGSMGGTHLNQPMVGGAGSCSAPGYWTVARDGGIFAFGGAPFRGSTGNLVLNKPIVGMAPTSDGLGYWLAASDGGVFAFSDATFFGSMGGTSLNQPVVGIAADSRGTGYWLVASDGGIFAFGTAGFFGSTGNITLNKPIVGMAATPDGQGYWLVASDGGVFAFGDAAFFGSTGAIHLNQPVVGMKPTADGGGYWLFASDGGVFAFGDAPFLGSMGAVRLNQPVVGGF